MKQLQEKPLRKSFRDYLKYIHWCRRICPLCALFSCLGVLDWITREREISKRMQYPLLSVLACGWLQRVLPSSCCYVHPTVMDYKLGLAARREPLNLSSLNFFYQSILSQHWQKLRIHMYRCIIGFYSFPFIHVYA